MIRAFRSNYAEHARRDVRRFLRFAGASLERARRRRTFAQLYASGGKAKEFAEAHTFLDHRGVRTAPGVAEFVG